MPFWQLGLRGPSSGPALPSAPVASSFLRISSYLSTDQVSCVYCRLQLFPSYNPRYQHHTNNQLSTISIATMSAQDKVQHYLGALDKEVCRHEGIPGVPSLPLLCSPSPDADQSIITISSPSTQPSTTLRSRLVCPSPMLLSAW